LVGLVKECGRETKEQVDVRERWRSRADNIETGQERDFFGDRKITS